MSQRKHLTSQPCPCLQVNFCTSHSTSWASDRRHCLHVQVEDVPSVPKQVIKKLYTPTTGLLYILYYPALVCLWLLVTLVGVSPAILAEVAGWSEVITHTAQRRERWPGFVPEARAVDGPGSLCSFQPFQGTSLVAQTKIQKAWIYGVRKCWPRILHCCWQLLAGLNAHPFSLVGSSTYSSIFANTHAKDSCLDMFC